MWVLESGLQAGGEGWTSGIKLCELQMWPQGSVVIFVQTLLLPFPSQNACFHSWSYALKSVCCPWSFVKMTSYKWFPDVAVTVIFAVCAALHKVRLTKCFQSCRPSPDSIINASCPCHLSVGHTVQAHREHVHPEDTTAAITLTSWHLGDRETDSKITCSTAQC